MMAPTAHFARLFTIDEANALLPKLRPMVEQILENIRRLKGASESVIRREHLDADTPDLMDRLRQDAEIAKLIGQVQGWVEANGSGQVTKIDRWGRRKLAYEIDRQREGYYVIMEASVDPQSLPEVERNLKLSPAILRYLIIRTDE